MHFSILEATTIPLYLKNKMKLFVHTIDDKVIYFGQNVHIPKSYHRFEGLVEKLYQEKKIIANNDVLLEIKEKTFSPAAAGHSRAGPRQGAVRRREGSRGSR